MFGESHITNKPLEYQFRLYNDRCSMVIISRDFNIFDIFSVYRTLSGFLRNGKNVLYGDYKVETVESRNLPEIKF